MTAVPMWHRVPQRVRQVFQKDAVLGTSMFVYLASVLDPIYPATATQRLCIAKLDLWEYLFDRGL